MSETLIAVIVGGLIGSLTPIINLIATEIRWKQEAKLEYLKSERSRLEKLFNENLERFKLAIKKDNYSPDMVSDIFLLMPKGVSNELEKWILSENTLKDEKTAYMRIAFAMKQSLSDIDKEILKLVSR